MSEIFRLVGSKIKRVTFAEPETMVEWNDGSVTVATYDSYCPELSLAIAVIKKLLS